MFQAGTGWLGWTPEVTLHTPMPLIELAMEGKYAYLRAISGVPDPQSEPEPKAREPADLIAYLRRRAEG